MLSIVEINMGGRLVIKPVPYCFSRGDTNGPRSQGFNERLV